MTGWDADALVKHWRHIGKGEEMTYRRYTTWLAWVFLFFGAISSRPVFGQLSGLLDGGVSEKKVTISAVFTAAGQGQPGQLFVTAQIKPDLYIYSITQGPGGPVKTTITVEESPQYRVGAFAALQAPEKKTDPYMKDVVIEAHHGTITWRAPIEFLGGADPARVRVKGTVRAQACQPNMCFPPTNHAFEAALGAPPVAPPGAKETGPGTAVASDKAGPPVPIEDLPAPSDKAAPPTAGNGLSKLITEPRAPGEINWRPYTSYESLVSLVSGSGGAKADTAADTPSVADPRAEGSLLVQIVLAFFGGMLLNLMPCVLPVIGLKILGFVEQAGQDRRHALLLNVAYSLGLMAVFMLLAAMAAGLGLGWGQQFQSTGFNIFLASLVFAMALSFLGVWEIPVPGFIGSGRHVELAEQEGLSGAFLKGMITTVLATPCTGPFMGGALGWAMKQSAGVIFAVFFAVGLGMAAPYLAIGAYPRLIRFLPKPGLWMETFKQIMGFVLLGTVIYLLTFLDWPYVVPTVGLFMALWLGCWWVNRTPHTEELPLRLRAWTEGAAMVGVAWVLLFPGLQGVLPEGFAFRGLAKVMEGRFDEVTDRAIARRMDQYEREGYELVKTGRVRAGKTVLVDITADWCVTCKTYEATAMNTAPVRELLARNGVVPLKADYTRQDPEVSRLLKSVGAGGVPVVAIYPAGRPQAPIVFRDGYTTGKIVEALQQAGPSPM